MNQELITRTEEWKQLGRQTDEQRKKAEAYYENELMKLIEEAFIENNKHKVYEDIEYLIMSVGTSYEPLVLSIQLLNPKRILFLYTEKTERIIEKIVRHCNLEATRFSKRKVKETDPLDIYREIKEVYLRWNKPQKLYIDITGGTKTMSAAAAMAGAVVDVQLVYVGSEDYLQDFRKPNPGSEQLYHISNPMEIFGDLEIEKAFALFSKHNYAGARERLFELKDSVPTPDIRQQLTFAYHLASTYEHWDALEFPQAYESICQLNCELERDSRINRNFLLMDVYPTLKRQEGILQKLKEMNEHIVTKKSDKILENADYIIPLMFTMYTNAEIRRLQEKYDMATLLLYRLLEMVEQRRLARYNLFASNMVYEKMVLDLEKLPHMKGLTVEEQIKVLKASFKEMREALFRKEEKRSMNLPGKISLLDGYIMLAVLGDELCKPGDGKRHLERLNRIRSMVSLRNNSIFAHGFGPVSTKDFDRFRGFVVDIFKEFCAAEGEDFDAYAKDMTWINPVDSKNYVGMEVSGECQ